MKAGTAHRVRFTFLLMTLMMASSWIRKTRRSWLIRLDRRVCSFLKDSNKTCFDPLCVAGSSVTCFLCAGYYLRITVIVPVLYCNAVTVPFRYRHNGRKQRVNVAFVFGLQDGKWNIGESEEEKEEGSDADEEEEEEEGDTAGEDEEEGEEDEEEGEEEESEEEDGHSDLESEQESETEEREMEDEETSAKTLSQEEMKAQQEAAKAELPYTFTGRCTHELTETNHIITLQHICFISNRCLCSSRELQ